MSCVPDVAVMYCMTDVEGCKSDMDVEEQSGPKGYENTRSDVEEVGGREEESDV